MEGENPERGTTYISFDTSIERMKNALQVCILQRDENGVEGIIIYTYISV